MVQEGLLLVRIGVVGLGIMGSEHASYLAAGDIREATVTAIADPDPARRDWAREHLGDRVARFETADALFGSGLVDGVIVAAPHFLHPPLAIQAFQAGLHVLVEKPVAVYSRAAEELNRAARESGRIFGIMYNQRTNPVYQKVREMVRTGALGELKRVSWVVTHWYRSQSYYDMGTWRATWAGEGGGVLLNQSPHQLDLWQWIVGMMPTRVRAFMAFGKYHAIEVEDDVTAYVEYPGGATATFITSTGEAPGTNRLEIASDRGKLVVEGDALTFWRLEVPERRFNREYRGGHGHPKAERMEIPVAPQEPNPVHGPESGHRGITQNWVNAITRGEPLIAPGAEGILGLTLSNAMHLSAWTDAWVDLPIDAEAFETMLRQRMATSKGKAWPVPV